MSCCAGCCRLTWTCGRRGKQRQVAAAGAAGGGVAGADGVVRRRVETGHHRLLATVVGTVTVRAVRLARPGRAQCVSGRCRVVAAERGGTRHGLARLAVTEAVRGSFDAAKAAIESRCGPVIGKRQLEQLVAAAAVDVDAFYAAEDSAAAYREHRAGAQRGRQRRRDAPRGAAARHRQSGRPPQEHLPHPAGPGEKPCRKRICAARRSVIFPAQPGGTRREVPGSDG